MLVTLKGSPNQVEIANTVAVGIAHFPDNDDNPVQEHKVHFFVRYNSAWAEVSLKTYNALVAAGNPPQNIS